MSKYALRMLGKEKLAKDLEPGDIILGFHYEPVMEVVSHPVSGKECHPDNKYAHEQVYFTAKTVDPLGIMKETEGKYVRTHDAMVRVGTVPLTRMRDGWMTYSKWKTPDGREITL